MGSLHARRMQAFLEHRPQDVFGRHRYDPADFGWTYAGLATEFKDYTERYHIETRGAIRSPRRRRRSQLAPRFLTRRVASVPANKNVF